MIVGWAKDCGLGVNTDKTELVIFTRKKEGSGFKAELEKEYRDKSKQGQKCLLSLQRSHLQSVGVVSEAHALDSHRSSETNSLIWSSCLVAGIWSEKELQET